MGLQVKQQPLLIKKLSYCKDGWNIHAGVPLLFE